MGTTFRALFPPAQGHAVVVDEPAEAPAVGGHGETILVVEDEPAVRQLTARILRRGGYAVIEAASGTEALALAADHHFNMLLTDLVMPQVSGPELAERIRQMHPGVPVLFMSGYSQDVLGPRGALSADAPLIQKPFAAQDLLKNVHVQLG